MDADERAARLAGEDQWSYVDGEFGPQVKLSAGAIWGREDVNDVNVQVWQCKDEQDGCPDQSREMAAEGKHMARHDPARVLADVAAKRAILDAHEELTIGCCNTCTEGMHSSEHQSWPCATVRLLALPYADQPGYREEWRP